MGRTIRAGSVEWITPVKIGDLFMNRFAIDEDGSHEILKIYYLEKRFRDYKKGGLTKNKGPNRILQENYYKTWKLNSGKKLPWKQK